MIASVVFCGDNYFSSPPYHCVLKKQSESEASFLWAHLYP